MKPKKQCLIWLIALVGCRNSADISTGKAVDPVQLSMDTNADSLLLDPKINSFSIGVYKNGKKHISHYGELDRGKGNLPTDSTIYEIASVSKTFTGILAANAVMEGKIMLEDDIRKYLEGDFPNFGFNSEPIRIRHLLTHTSGMPRFLPESINEQFSNIDESLPFRINNIQKGYSKKDFFQDLASVKLNAAPGSVYEYSNVDTELMSKILENVYGQQFDIILEEYFMKNANMVNTHIHLPKQQETYLANGYGMTNKPAPLGVVMFGGDGGVKTTMADMVKYMELQLDNDNETVTESHRVLYNKGSLEMAYYWNVSENEEYGKYFSIHGGAFGTQNWLFILPKYKLGVSVITNQSGPETAGKLLGTVRGLIRDLK